MRKTIKLNEGWYFAKTNEIPQQSEQSWEAVTLPHTWNAQDGQDGGNDYYRGTCMYARELELPELAAGEHVILEIPGAAMTAEVYWNGTLLAHHEGGYSTFRVDVTETARRKNFLCISVDNGDNDRVYPQKADFTFYGGLYRGASLIIVPAAHFELIRDGTCGVKVTPRIEGTKAIVTAESWTCGGIGVRFCVSLPENGSVVAERTVSVDNGYAKAELTIENVHLWDGVDDPYLYELRAELLADEAERMPENGADASVQNMAARTAADEVTVKFGCRTFSFDKEKGFFLNGRPYPLRGVSRHQDRAGVGNALTEAMHEEDMEIIREMGANTIRLAHYQHAQYFYDLCDRYGMIVWAEIPYITKHMPNGRENTLSQMRELVTQCYNHPSIVCWGLSNEITASGSVDEDMLENHRLLNELCHRMDATRPTAMAHVFMLETDSPIIGIPDIGSYNLYFGWYLGELGQNEGFFDEYHAKFPDRIIGFSEYGADANPQFQAEKPERGDYSEGYQALYHEHLLKCINERPYLWATHVWNMFDFAADGRDEGGAHGLNQKGLVTIDRKIKKDAFYLYQAAWSKEPVVHLCGRRYVERAGDETEIKIYSNQPEVTLFVDGKAVETKRAKENAAGLPMVFAFRIPISGEHKLTARGGEGEDSMTIRKVAEPNKAYLFQKETIINWFDKEELKPDYFSIEDTMGEIMANPAGAAILGKLMRQASASRGDVAKSTEGNANLQRMMAGMKVAGLLKQAGDAIKPEQIKALNAALQQIKK